MTLVANASKNTYTVTVKHMQKNLLGAYAQLGDDETLNFEYGAAIDLVSLRKSGTVNSIVYTTADGGIYYSYTTANGTTVTTDTMTMPASNLEIDIYYDRVTTTVTVKNETNGGAVGVTLPQGLMVSRTQLAQRAVQT